MHASVVDSFTTDVQRGSSPMHVLAVSFYLAIAVGTGFCAGYVARVGRSNTGHMAHYVREGALSTGVANSRWPRGPPHAHTDRVAVPARASRPARRATFLVVTRCPKPLG